MEQAVTQPSINTFDSKTYVTSKVRKTIYYILFSTQNFALVHFKLYNKNKKNTFFYFYPTVESLEL